MKIDTLKATEHRTETTTWSHEFHPRVINNTTIEFSEQETSLLNMGINFNLPNDRKDSLISELFNADPVVKCLMCE